MDRLYLKKNWDKPLSWNDIHDKTPTTNFHHINNDASKVLQNFIKHKERGSLLLSGDFGVGKTSSTIFNILESDSSKLPVILNILEFSTLQNDTQTSPTNLLNILRQMAINLADELPQLKIDIRNENRIPIIRRWVKINNKSDVNFNKNLENICRKMDHFLFDITITEITYIEKKNEIISNEETNTSQTMLSSENTASILSKIAQLTSKLTSSISSESIMRKNNESENEIFKKRAGSSLDGITNKFIKILKELENDLKIQLIFIIDELDCYDKTPQLILNSLKKIKNLITLSNIQFIFIVGKNTYKESLIDESFNTLFSSRVYINRPSGELFAKYIDEIVENVISDNRSWEIYKWHLIARSRGTFYNLIQNIKSEIKFNDETLPYIEITSMKSSDIKISTIYYAMNTIYKYYLPEVKLNHLCDVLHAELETIIESYILWTPINREPMITLNSCNTIISQHTKLNDDEKFVLSKAKRALITYLYKICSIKHTLLEDYDTDDFRIDWSSIQEYISFGDVLNGISGPITKEELEFRDNYAELLREVSKYLNILNIEIFEIGFDIQIEQLANNTNIIFPDNSIGKIIEVNNTINDIPLHERHNSLEDIQGGILAIENLKDYLHENLILDKGILLEKHWGELQHEDNKHILIGDTINKPAPLNTKMLILNKSKSSPLIESFSLSFILNLSKEAILNILLGINQPDDNHFYMGRFDSRDSENNRRSAVLYKEISNSWYYLENQLITYYPFQSDKDTQVKCSYDGKKILGEIKVGKHYKKIFEHKIRNLKFSYIGFGNELGEATISDIKFKDSTKRDKARKVKHKKNVNLALTENIQLS